jgi:hypothetical protein
MDGVKDFNPNLISDFVLSLPKQVLADAQSFVKNVFKLRQSAEYQAKIKSKHADQQINDPGNKSILMCYDFHYSKDSGLKLIEINTNASFLLLGLNLYRTKNQQLPIPDFDDVEIVSNIKTEMDLCGLKSQQIVIIDDQPQSQKLYPEFLCYQDLFERAGFQVKIQDFRQAIPGSSFCYNRWTDFYLENTDSRPLLNQFHSKEVCFSPNPYEYLLLADKRRFMDFYESPDIQKFVPRTEVITAENQNDIWTARKSFFFKPSSSFGSKQSYKGASVSRKMFDTLCDGRFIAQEFVAPGIAEFKLGNQEHQFKYDLRFYAYQDRIQMVMARLYQGQVTNSQTPLGGFACVQFN